MKGEYVSQTEYIKYKIIDYQLMKIEKFINI